MQVMEHKSERHILALKPRADITRSPHKSGIRWPQPKDCFDLKKIFGKIKPVVGGET